MFFQACREHQAKRAGANIRVIEIGNIKPGRLLIIALRTELADLTATTKGTEEKVIDFVFLVPFL